MTATTFFDCTDEQVDYHANINNDEVVLSGSCTGIHHGSDRIVAPLSPLPQPTSFFISGFSNQKIGRNRSILGASLIVSTLLLPYTAAFNCISLTTSSTCSAFSKAQISTSDALKSQFPFLAFVNDTAQFDTKFVQYMEDDYVKFKYQDLFGCNNITLTQTAPQYARFTQTILCSRMIQDSLPDCKLADDTATPVCADTCAQFATSQQIIVSNNQTCGSPRSDSIGIIRSDFAICSNPVKSLDQSCIEGSDNEPANCGYRDNVLGLCIYCGDESPNSTDTCCYNSNAPSKCAGLKLPTFSNLPPIVTTSAVPTASAPPSADGSKHSGLSGGAIAGITIGALLGIGLLVFAILMCWRRHRYGEQVGIFNHPIKSPPSATFTTVGPASGRQGYDVLASSRVARMSALENVSTNNPHSPPARGRTRGAMDNHSSSSEYGTPESRKKSPPHRPLHPPPRGRNASLSSSSVMMDPISPITESEKNTSPEYGSPQSEQLPYFKDYYSSDDIHPGDRVATLWAYAPRAPDEFELERGDMLKVVGIWDDGWATGILLPERAEDMIRRRSMRDSGMSAQTSHRRISSPQPAGEIKAFPLVCVCLPDHWQKTIESEVQGAELESSSQLTATSSPPRRVGEKSSSRFKDDLNVSRSGAGPSP